MDRVNFAGNVIDMKKFPVTLILIWLFVSCTTHRSLNFANNDWLISEDYGQIINTDTSYRFTFGERLIPVDMPIICSMDSAKRYPGLDRYLWDIMRKANLDSSEILFYAPEMQSMFVKVNDNFDGIRPFGVSSDLREPKKLITYWTSKDNPEYWHRQPMEMHIYTYLTKPKKQFLVVSIFNYGDEEIAQIQILQTATRKTAKMKLPNEPIMPFFKRDVTDMGQLLFWASIVRNLRAINAANYEIGNELKQLREAKSKATYKNLISKGDSALIAKDHRAALKYYQRAISNTSHVRSKDVYNAACAASIIGDTAIAMDMLWRNVKQFSKWYVTHEDKDLKSLHSHSRWKEFTDTMRLRQDRLEANYDRKLKARLEGIFRTDQDVRYRFIEAYKAERKDSALIAELTAEMRQTDSCNLAEIKDILTKHGWVGKRTVGNACNAIWIVIQHSDIDTQKWALPMLKSAADSGDISRASIAMLEDRILVNENLPQIYGTQFSWGEKGELILYPLENPEQVDELRKSIGLGPLEDYLNAMRKSHGAK